MKTERIEPEESGNIEKMMINKGVSNAMLARACGVSEMTVRRWVSQNAISEKFITRIEKLMEDDGASVNFIEGGQSEGLKLEMSLSDHAKLSRRAAEAGCTLEEFIAKHLESFL